MMKQHRGSGGDTTISDGLRAAAEMKDSHTDQFHRLTKTKIYFLAKGFDTNYDGTVREFFKVNKEPVIKWASNFNVRKLRAAPVSRRCRLHEKLWFTGGCILNVVRNLDYVNILTKEICQLGVHLQIFLNMTLVDV